MAFTSRRSASAKISLSALSMVPFSFRCCGKQHNRGWSDPECLRPNETGSFSSRRVTGGSERLWRTHFDKVVEQIDPLLQGLLQVVAQRQVLGVVADLLHAPPLRLLRGLLRPVLVFVVSILGGRQRGYDKQRNVGKRSGLLWV